MNFGFRGLFSALYQRVILSYRTTLIGLAIVALGVVFDYYSQSTNHIIKYIAQSLGVLLLLVKEKNGYTLPAGPGLGMLFAVFTLGAFTPANATAESLLATKLTPDLTMDVALSVGAVSYDVTAKQWLGDVTFSGLYALDYKHIVAIGVGASFANGPVHGVTATAMIAGPSIDTGVGSVRFGVITQYQWIGAVHDWIVGFAPAIQF